MSEQKPTRPRGRPRVLKGTEPGSRVTTWVEPAVHDRLVKLAGQRRESVSTFVRNILILRLP